MSKDTFKYMSNEYPYLDGVDVYAYENDFNYNLWGVNTVIRLLNVRWDISYDNVVKFKDNAARNKWTEDNTKAKYVIETAVNIQPDGEVKLDIPFDVLQKYNYIVVDYPMAPVSGEVSDRIAHVGYFIKDVMQLAPSTTKCNVFVDYWYTFINELDITYLDLERGHAPVAAVKAEDYLKNPIASNQFLLAPDVNFGKAGDRVKQAAEWIANDGQIYAVIATTGNALSQDWGHTERRDMYVPSIATPNFFGGSTYDYIAIPENRLSEFIINCNLHRPHFVQTIEGIFFVPAKLIKLGDIFTWENFNNIPMAFLDTSQYRFNLINLKKQDFNYDSRYADLAKLYTFPYAKLEITDEYGNVSEVNIENTVGKIDIDAHLNLIYPFLGLDVMMLGVGDTQEVASTFGYRGNREFKHSGKWYDLIKTWNIPSFIVAQDRRMQAQYDRYFSNEQAKAALNTAYDNAINTSDITYGNTEAGLLTSKNISIRNADTSKIISDRNSNNTKVIADRNSNMSYDNAIDGSKMTILDSYNSSENIDGINIVNKKLARDQFTFFRQEQNAARTAAVMSTIRSVQETNTQNFISTGLTAAAAIPASVASVAAGQPGGAALAIGGVAFSGIQTYAAAVTNEAAAVANANDQVDYFNYMNGGLTYDNLAETYNENLGTLSDNINDYSNSVNYRKMVNQTECQALVQSWNQAATLINGANSNVLIAGGQSRVLKQYEGSVTPYYEDTAVFEGTAVRTKNTNLQNNTDNFNTTNQNTINTYNTAIQNANDTYNYSHNNAMASKDLANLIAIRHRDLALEAIDNGNKAQGVEAPAVYGTTSNAGTAATRPIGLFVNIATQSKAAIKSAGDYFLRYGYALNQAWEPTKLQLMKHFTYWKAGDVWVSSNANVIEEANETIKNIFMKGVTVWDTPEDVGNVSIYENL